MITGNAVLQILYGRCDLFRPMARIWSEKVISTCITWCARRGMPMLHKIDLAKIDVIHLGMAGLAGLQDADIKHLKDFIERGGRTILAANGFFAGTVAGEVIALAESLWWHWIADNKTKNSDNAVLLSNLLKKSQKRE